MMINSHQMTSKEMSKAQMLKSYLTSDNSKAIAYYKPFLGKNQYFVCVHRKDTDKKTKQTREYLEPIFRTENLDSAIFVWHNIYVFDTFNRAKKYENHIMTISELDAKIKAEKKGIKDKEIKVHIVEDCDDIYGFETDKAYTPLGNNMNNLDAFTKLLMEMYC